MLTDVGFYLSEFKGKWSSANLIPKFLHVFLVSYTEVARSWLQNSWATPGILLGPGSKWHDLQAGRKKEKKNIRATFDLCRKYPGTKETTGGSLLLTPLSLHYTISVLRKCFRRCLRFAYSTAFPEKRIACLTPSLRWLTLTRVLLTPHPYKGPLPKHEPTGLERGVISLLHKITFAFLSDDHELDKKHRPVMYMGMGGLRFANVLPSQVSFTSQEWS